MSIIRNRRELDSSDGSWSKSYMVLNRLTSRFHLTPTNETRHEPKCTTRITKSRIAPNQMILLLFETSKFHTPSSSSTHCNAESCHQSQTIKLTFMGLTPPCRGIFPPCRANLQPKAVRQKSISGLGVDPIALSLNSNRQQLSHDRYFPLGRVKNFNFQ